VDILQLIISSTILYAAPLIFTALGGVFSERAGVVNIGLEGLMVMGAFTGIVSSLYFESLGFGNASPWFGILFAIFIGAVFSLFHAVASITLRADQVVSGVALNFLAIGLSVFLVRNIYDKGQTDVISFSISKINFPFLSDIPFIGTLFFSNIAITSYIAIIFAFIVWYVIYKTPFGLRLRSVGEHPMAADTMGINVSKMRYIGVILSGAFAGLGGAVYALTSALQFSGTTIAGQGFIALAALIFGKWNPIGALGAALFFGLAQSLAVSGATLPLLQDIPSVFLSIAPYVLTIVALTGFIGRADAPKAIGTPYIKGKR
jgi:general nucleoside transport system permease protein